MVIKRNTFCIRLNNCITMETRSCIKPQRDQRYKKREPPDRGTRRSVPLRIPM